MSVQSNFLMCEYKRWISERNKEDTSGSLLEFLNYADLIKGHEDSGFCGIPTQNDRYILIVDFYDNGDYSILTDLDGKLEYTDERYSGVFEWDASIEECRDEALQILRDIRESVIATEDYVAESVKRFLLEAEEGIEKRGFQASRLWDDYAGCRVTFHNTRIKKMM